MTKKKASPKKPTGVPRSEDFKFPHPGTTPMAEVIERAVQLLPAGSLIPDQKSRAYLRWFAGLFYSSDLNAVSVATMSKHPLFKDVGYDQLAHWSRLDGWPAQREALLNRVQTQLQERVADEIVRKRMAELGELKKVSQKVLAKLLPEPHKFVELTIWIKDAPTKVCKVCGNPEPGCNDPFWGVSGEKLVTALAKLMELMLMMEGIVLDKMASVKPEGKATDAGTVPIEGQISEDEAREAAHAVLRRRHALASPTREDEGDGGGVDDDAEAPVGPGG